MLRTACYCRLGSSICAIRSMSSQYDFSHEKPAPEQLEHIQRRISDTIPLMFKQRLDYTFYRKDIFCDDRIFRLQKRGIDELMQHLGTISVLGQLTIPHIEMETISIVPVIEDGTVRCRWRVKYVSFFRLFTNFKLFRKQYRLNNLSWYDGYSVFTVDGNGQVSKLTIQRMRDDESKLLDEKSPAEKLAEKIAVFRPRPATGSPNFITRSVESEEDRKR